MKRALLFLFVFASFAHSDKVLAQAAFRIPQEVTDFKNYSIPEHCIALMDRLNKQLATEQDSTYVIRDILTEEKIDTTPSGVREQLAACGIKFRNMEVPADSIYKETMEAQVAGALLLAWAARDTGWFYSVINDDINRAGQDANISLQGVMGRVTDAMFSFHPLSDDDFRLWDSLYTAMVTSPFVHHNGDLKVFTGLINALSRQARTLSRYDRSRHRRVLRDILLKIDSMRVSDLNYDTDDDHPLRGPIRTVKYIKRRALLELHSDSLLDVLRNGGPDQYIDALVGIEHISGFRDVELPGATGVGREMRELPGNIVYKGGEFLLSEAVTHDQLPDGALYTYNPSQPYIVVYMESLCSSKASMPTDAHRDLIQGADGGNSACMRVMEALKWINKNHPDVQIVLWTPFRGQVGPLLTETPAKEARELVKALDEFYGISADVVMYNTESYNMPDSYDRRRIDISIEFIEWLREMTGAMYERTPKMVIVSPGGKIMASTYKLKVVAAMMDWYRNSPSLAGAGNTH